MTTPDSDMNLVTKYYNLPLIDVHIIRLSSRFKILIQSLITYTINTKILHT